MDLQKSIRMVVDTGKVFMGTREVQRSIHSGQAKLIILTKNMPMDLKIGLKKIAKMHDIPVIEFDGTAMDLGSVCGRPHPILVMSVVEAGDSDILSAVG